MPDSVKTMTRDVLRELGDSSGRTMSKEVVLRHILREAAWIASRFPNVIRAEGSPSSGPTHEVDLTDIMASVSLAGHRINVRDVWVNGVQLKKLTPTDMEGLL